MRQKRVHFVLMQRGCWDQTNKWRVIDCYLGTWLGNSAQSHHSYRFRDRQSEKKKPSFEEGIALSPWDKRKAFELCLFVLYNREVSSCRWKIQLINESHWFHWTWSCLLRFVWRYKQSFPRLQPNSKPVQLKKSPLTSFLWCLHCQVLRKRKVS